MNHIIKIAESEEGYAAWCDELPGCASQGCSEEEAIENMKEAIEDYLAVQQEQISY